MRGKSAQAAMEFLMTYGWAILVVLVVIGALAYFGVLSPSTLLPEKCTFPVSVNCVDHSVSGSAVTLIMLNGAGRDMKINRVSASSEALGSGSLGCSCITGGLPLTLRNGEKATFTLDSPNPGDASNCDPDTTGPLTSCSFKDTGRDKNRYNVTVYYSWLDSQTVTHTLPGEMLARKP